jgi:hypothetical protein
MINKTILIYLIIGIYFTSGTSPKNKLMYFVYPLILPIIYFGAYLENLRK